MSIINNIKMPVSIITPAWNLWSLTAACIESLAKNTPADTLEVIVVDNGSTDETAVNLEPLGRALFGKNFHRLRLEKNMGFAMACNYGASKAGGNLLFFLNNDTTARPGWLDPLARVFSDNKIGAAGPLLLYPDGTLQHCGIAFGPFNNVCHLYESFPGKHPLARKKRPLQAITGAAFMIPGNLFAAAGGFCEEYVNGFEDMDLCFRLGREGYKLAVEPESIFYHHASQTSGRFKHDAENGRLLKKRWGAHIRPDLHIHARLDGYETRIGPDLSCWLEAPGQRRLELEKQVKETDETSLIRILRKLLEIEPLWEKGWAMLADALVAKGKPEQAFSSCLAGAAFFQHGCLLAKMRQIAAAAPELASVIQNSPVMAEANGSDNPDENIRKSRRAIVRSARSKAGVLGDHALAAILDKWLEENYG